MATSNVQALCSIFKVDLLNGSHALGTAVVTRTGTLAADPFMAALYFANTSNSLMNAAATIYTTAGELTGTNYTPGGWTVVFLQPTYNNPSSVTNANSTAYVTPTQAITISTLTASGFDTVLFYNAKDATKRAVSVHTFGSQTITAGTFTLTMPSNAAGTALINFA